MNRLVGLFGTSSSGKTVYLVTLFNRLREDPGGEGLALDFKDNMDSYEYLDYLAEGMYVHKEFPHATDQRSIKRVSFEIKGISKDDPDLIETVFTFNTYDFAGETMYEIYSPSKKKGDSSEETFQIKDENLQVEGDESYINVKKSLDELIQNSSSFMFMVDPTPANKFSQDRFIYAVLMEIITVHQNKYKLKPNQKLKNISLAFVLTKTDTYRENRNEQRQLSRLIGLSWNYAKLYFSRERIGTFHISSLGVKPKVEKTPEGYEYQLVPDNINPQGILEPVRFFNKQFQEQGK